MAQPTIELFPLPQRNRRKGEKGGQTAATALSLLKKGEGKVLASSPLKRKRGKGIPMRFWYY